MSDGPPGGGPLRVAALVKQIPAVEDLRLTPDGRLDRAGCPLHMNDYCRRAVAKGLELARLTGGSLTVITMGPPSAQEVLREALAFGADHAVLLTDPLLSASDSIATAAALAAVLRRLGGFDLVLTGLNAIDADTGQTPPQVAALLGLPFCHGARSIVLAGGRLSLDLEQDDEAMSAEVVLPAVVSCAERLCDPCKIRDPAMLAKVDPARIQILSAHDLGPGVWGRAASLSWVGRVVDRAAQRQGVICSGDAQAQVSQAIARLRQLEAARTSVPRPSPRALPLALIATGPIVAVIVEPRRPGSSAPLLAAAADLAVRIGGRVIALGPADAVEGAALERLGADGIVCVKGAALAEDVAATLAPWLKAERPWAVLAPATPWGREVASRLAAEVQAGLTGDATGLEVSSEGRLIAWKPAFGGRCLAEILCVSEIQMATIRNGVFAIPAPRDVASVPSVVLYAAPRTGLRITARRRTDTDDLAAAAVVFGLGAGISPDDYPLLGDLAARLGGVLCATRKVTDKGWLPRARQVGITGRSLAPRLYLAIGLSGKFNHMAGVQAADAVIAINIDPDAPVFGYCDIGLVGDWRDLLSPLVARIAAEARFGLPAAAHSAPA